MVSVKGVYDGKVVKLLEPVFFPENVDVIVTFLAEGNLSGEDERRRWLRESKEFHQQVQDSILEADPELAAMSEEEIREDFEKLSQKVAQGLPFKDWTEAERFMRGEAPYDLDR